ncbi:MAG TPA: RNHCP domain-containing protein [Candidatus Paceibacterota bacterium]|nr:RNHCP domain-containing protein [Candidatus Pacearchaeota archaeon]HPZ74585.1 RNHCP domain-containing protein [Candidatus Pacearchaeota archaeon]HQD89169.1 RNHCP domain-containing protein [Candidatus Pacearchaeota archaeon]HRR39334.1 RNHCP domain-containing protein [Candidatus Paceibacterota bacterium]
MQLPEKKFQKRVENFTCDKCGFFVKGTGYTDHCPNCLWSKHVDINPGDRKAKCGGLMEPVGLGKKGDKYIIYYYCQRCGYKFQVKVASSDNFKEILKLNSKKI